MIKKSQKRYIKSLSCIDYPLPGELPSDPYDAFGHILVDIGYEGMEGVSNYSFLVYTSKNLTDEIARSKDKFLFGQHMLIVEKFDYEVIKKAIESILPEIEQYGHDVT
jgi:hypothetical protein